MYWFQIHFDQTKLLWLVRSPGQFVGYPYPRWRGYYIALTSLSCRKPKGSADHTSRITHHTRWTKPHRPFRHSHTSWLVLLHNSTSIVHILVEENPPWQSAVLATISFLMVHSTAIFAPYHMCHWDTNMWVNCFDVGIGRFSNNKFGIHKGILIITCNSIDHNAV